jgi:Zn-dependent protease with chaperone function
VLPDLVNPKEKTYLALALVVSAFFYLFLIFSIIGVFWLAIAALSVAILQGIAIGHLRGNGVRVSERQFPDVLQLARELCGQLGIAEVPPIYIMQSGGLLNAFATRFFGRNYVCITSDIFELAYERGPDEVAFVLAHELTHIKRNHVWWKSVVFPAAFVPFLGAAYSRACEYTCDAYAAFLRPAGAEGAVLVLAAGKRVSQEMNAEAFLAQAAEPEDFMMWLAEHVSTHPNLPKRLHAVRWFAAMRNAAPVPVPGPAPMIYNPR